MSDAGNINIEMVLHSLNVSIYKSCASHREVAIPLFHVMSIQFVCMRSMVQLAPHPMAFSSTKSNVIWHWGADFVKSVLSSRLASVDKGQPNLQRASATILWIYVSEESGKPLGCCDGPL